MITVHLAKKLVGPPPFLDEEIYEEIHTHDLESEDVIELGPTVSGQGSLFERMRTNLTQGEVLSRTFDEAVKRRCNIDTWSSDSTPKQVDEITFDSDVEKIKSLTIEDLENFDLEVCYARGEIRDPASSGVFVNRPAGGFGREVFGIAYDAISGQWSMTNALGLHAHCEQRLRMKIEFNSDVDRDDVETAIICGFIFQLPSLQTPVMTPYGWRYIPPKFLKKALEELWSWKMFIMIHEDEIEPKKRILGKKLFTPEVALEAQKQFG